MKTDIAIVATVELPANRGFAAVSGSAPFEHEMKAYQEGRSARAAGILPPPVNYGTSYETAWTLGWKAQNDQAQRIGADAGK